MRLPLLASLLLPFALYAGCGSSACPDGDQSPDGDTLVDGDADQSDQPDATDTSDDTDSDFEIAPPELPRLTDWECPPEWRSVPAFVDENGNEDVPEGMHQYTICEPPEYWDGPSGPVKLKSWECPQGWVPVIHETLTDENGLPFSWCEPPALPEECPEGFMPLLGHSECVHIGDPCPVGDFPEIPVEVTGRRIYIKEGSTGGDGTIGSPFGTINEALAVSQAGDVLVIGPGRYREMAVPTVDLTLWGSCVEKTIIDAPGPHDGSLGAVTVRNGIRVQVSNMKLTGLQNGVRVLDKGSRASLAGIWVDRATRNGMSCEKGAIESSNALITKTMTDHNGEHGRGISIFDGCLGKIENIIVHEVHDAGIVAFSLGTAVTITNVVVHRTQPIAGGTWAGQGGNGLWVESAAKALISRGLFEQNREVAIYASEECTGLTLTDVTVRDTLAAEEGPYAGFGRGLEVSRAAHVTMERGLFERNRDLGIYTGGENTVVTMTDVMVRDTTAVTGKDWAGILNSGYGLGVEDAAQVTVERGLFERNRTTGIHAMSQGTIISLSDVTVRDTLGVERRTDKIDSGRGLNVQDAAQATVERGLFERNRDVGIVAMDLGTTISLSDVTVRDTLAVESGTNAGDSGRGLNVQDAAQVNVERGLFERNRDSGIVAKDEGTIISLSDVTVRDTLAVESGTNAGDSGRGLNVQDAALVNVKRGLFERNREAGVLAKNDGTVVTLTDVTVRDTQARERGEDAGIFGRGLHAIESARVTVKRGLFERNWQADISVAMDGTAVSLVDVTVRGPLLGGADAYSIKGERGLNVQEAAKVTVERGLFERSRDVGIFASDEDTVVTLVDLTLRDTLSIEGIMSSSRGMNVQEAANVVVERGMFKSNHGIGIFAGGRNVVVNLIDITVQNTKPDQCSLLPEGDPNRCVLAGMQGFSKGIAVYQYANVDARRFHINSNDILGVQIARDGHITLHDGVVSNQAIGVNIQVPGYDLSSLQNNVRYDNQRNMAYDDLPIPDPAEAMSDIIDPATRSQSTVPKLLMPLPACYLPMRPLPAMHPIVEESRREANHAP